MIWRTWRSGPCRSQDDQTAILGVEPTSAGRQRRRAGTRASANTSGSDFDRVPQKPEPEAERLEARLALEPIEIAEPVRSAPNEENLFLLPDCLSNRKLFSKLKSGR